MRAPNYSRDGSRKGSAGGCPPHQSCGGQLLWSLDSTSHLRPLGEGAEDSEAGFAMVRIRDVDEVVRQTGLASVNTPGRYGMRL
jgi:hypothetical protein